MKHPPLLLLALMVAVLSVTEGRHQEMLTRAFRFALVKVHDNRRTIRDSVQHESPWWMPGFIDDRIAVQMLDRIEPLLLEMSLDSDHPLRGDFNLWLLRWSDARQNSEEYRRWGGQLRDEMLVKQELQDYLYMQAAVALDAQEPALQQPAFQVIVELLADKPRQMTA